MCVQHGYWVLSVRGSRAEHEQAGWYDFVETEEDDERRVTTRATLQ
jgi:hypothetical protein